MIITLRAHPVSLFFLSLFLSLPLFPSFVTTESSPLEEGGREQERRGRREEEGGRQEGRREEEGEKERQRDCRESPCSLHFRRTTREGKHKRTSQVAERRGKTGERKEAKEGGDDSGKVGFIFLFTGSTAMPAPLFPCQGPSS